MEKSKDELLAGISELSGLDPFPDEIFYRSLRSRTTWNGPSTWKRCGKEAGKLKRRPEFNNLYRAFVLDYSQRQKQTGKVTRFTDQPIELNCGNGKQRIWGSRPSVMTRMPCRSLIMPAATRSFRWNLKNVDTARGVSPRLFQVSHGRRCGGQGRVCQCK